MHAPTKVGHNVKLAASTDVSQADHRPGDGRHCPNGGLCCDVFCHAIVPLPEQAGSRCDVRLARHGFTPGMTLAVHNVNGLDRPPRRLPS